MASEPAPARAFEIETYSGQFVDTSDPQPDTITLDDIAHALALTCRYGGHCRRFYSVAEHAVFVSRRVERRGHGIATQLAALHHDDAEAYLGDVPRPMKPLLGDAYTRLSARMDATIVAALGLPHDALPVSAPVKMADTWSLFVEAHHLLPSGGRRWGDGEQFNLYGPGRVSRVVTPDYWKGGLPPGSAKALYLSRHHELMEAHRGQGS